MGAPAYFNNTIFYLGCYGDHLKAFRIANGSLSATPISQATTANIDFPGSSPSVSANGTGNAIVWVLRNDAFGSSGPGILYAYNATNLANGIYNSSQAGLRDRLGGAVKFTVPTVANGKVYVGSEYSVSVFGLSAGWTAAPAISPNGGANPYVFTNSVLVTLSDATAGAQAVGSTPAPRRSSSGCIPARSRSRRCLGAAEASRRARGKRTRCCSRRGREHKHRSSRRGTTERQVRRCPYRLRQSQPRETRQLPPDFEPRARCEAARAPAPRAPP